LIEALDGVQLKRYAKPLRFVVQDIYRVESDNVIAGRVESGTMRRGDEVIFYPSGVKGKIKKIIVFGGELEEAEAGDSIGIVAGCEPRRGDVCGVTENPPAPTKEFKGEAVLLEDSLKAGDVVELRCSTQRVKCNIKEILEKIDSETGAVTEQHPRSLVQHEAATIIFATEPIVVEQFSDIPELGRFVLVRDKNIGAGVVLETSA
jgi:elongation factor 1-alpha